MSDHETEQKLANREMIVSELGNKNQRLNNRFEMVLAAVGFLLVVIGMVLMFK